MSAETHHWLSSGPSRSDLHIDLAHARCFRSAVLFHVGRYGRCAADISDAVAQGYPRSLQYKLREREARCLQRLGYVHTTWNTHGTPGTQNLGSTTLRSQSLLYVTSL